MKMRLLGAAALAAVIGTCASASASSVTWDLNSPTGTLGATQSYTSGGFTIVASGFGIWSPWNPADLYGHPSGLGVASVYDSDFANAIAYYNTNYPLCPPQDVPCQTYIVMQYGDQVNQALIDQMNYNGGYSNDEIYNGTSVQIDVSQPLSQGINHYQFEMGGITSGAEWSVYGSNSTGPGALLTPLYVNQTDGQTPHALGGFTYYDFAYSGPDDPTSGVLLETFAGTSAPEPSTWAMMLAGFAFLGYAGYQGRRSAVAAEL
jgi:hypothetical protein